MTKHGVPLAFLRDLVADPPADCVLWPYAVNAKGYANIWWERRNFNAHRVALILFQGADQPDLIACHGPCHDRRCVNPLHLYWGTDVDNALDKRRDGTHRVGEAHPSSRLTAADVAAIRDRYAAGGIFQRELAVEYGVSQGHIGGVVSGRFWRHTYREPS